MINDSFPRWITELIEYEFWKEYQDIVKHQPGAIHCAVRHLRRQLRHRIEEVQDLGQALPRPEYFSRERHRWERRLRSVKELLEGEKRFAAQQKIIFQTVRDEWCQRINQAQLELRRSHAVNQHVDEQFFSTQRRLSLDETFSADGDNENSCRKNEENADLDDQELLRENRNLSLRDDEQGQTRQDITPSDGKNDDILLQEMLESSQNDGNDSSPSSENVDRIICVQAANPFPIENERTVFVPDKTSSLPTDKQLVLEHSSILPPTTLLEQDVILISTKEPNTRLLKKDSDSTSTENDQNTDSSTNNESPVSSEQRAETSFKLLDRHLKSISLENTNYVLSEKDTNSLSTNDQTLLEKVSDKDRAFFFEQDTVSNSCAASHPTDCDRGQTVMIAAQMQRRSSSIRTQKPLEIGLRHIRQHQHKLETELDREAIQWNLEQVRLQEEVRRGQERRQEDLRRELNQLEAELRSRRLAIETYDKALDAELLEGGSLQRRQAQLHQEHRLIRDRIQECEEIGREHDQPQYHLQRINRMLKSYFGSIMIRFSHQLSIFSSGSERIQLVALCSRCHHLLRQPRFILETHTFQCERCLDSEGTQHNPVRCEQLDNFLTRLDMLNVQIHSLRQMQRSLSARLF